MNNIKKGGSRTSVDFVTERIFRFQDVGVVPTDGVQYSSIATFGTTAVNIIQEKFDPGFSMRAKLIEVALAQRFTGLNGSFVASINYYWTAQSKDFAVPSAGNITAGSLGPINISGTYAKAVGTNTTSDDVFSGYIPVASLPYFPCEFTLVAINPNRAAGVEGKVKNSSYIRVIGEVIPGT